MQLAIMLTEQETNILESKESSSLEAFSSLKEKLRRHYNLIENEEYVPVIGNDDGELYDLCLDLEKFLDK